MTLVPVVCAWMGTWGVGRLAEGGSCVVWRLSDRYSVVSQVGKSSSMVASDHTLSRGGGGLPCLVELPY